MIRRATERPGRVLTPLRVTIAVGLVAVVAIVAAQFMDTSGVAIATNDYAVYPGLESVAPPPQVEVDTPGTLHAVALILVALTAVAGMALALAGKTGAGLAVAAAGLVGVALTLAVDLPNALDESAARLSYDDVDAELLAGFWVQLVSSATLIACGGLIALHARGRRR